MTKAEARQIVVPHVHLFHDPLQRLCRLLGVRDDGRDEVGNSLINRQLDPLGVDQNHAHLGRLRAHQERGNHRVDKARLARPGGTGDEQVGHLGEVGDDESALDILAEANSHGVDALGRGPRAQNVSQRHDLAVLVGDFDADRTLPRDRRQDRHLVARDRVTDVLGEGSDPLNFDAGRKFDLIARDRGSATQAGDLGIHLELIEYLGESCDDLFVCRASCLWRRTRSQDGCRWQSVRSAGARPRWRRVELASSTFLARLGVEAG